ncbi:hypothetical protein CMQ_6678 [Grosmannia clavigera kw1407]|uniref:Uncharacterized protein n=1 Tax=Grosmannia clavigera (strain kw1407 / UAMH 11150) TaxID=655863 RepID=F0X6K9_GROCL|nr:uncharacterized protein CMQ_6678 [Grosmannia clavigera kw1407]EFX06357.1 hypothetical protein CMQ_6678 [Grosmannia clavigera kw1407]
MCVVNIRRLRPDLLLGDNPFHENVADLVRGRPVESRRILDGREDMAFSMRCHGSSVPGP